MKISIAGAGAGKTTAMAESVISIREQLDKSLNVFCMAFTNSAVQCIQAKLQKHYGQIPDNIIVSTIHSFLYQELIKPYYFLLYGKQYSRISTAKLPQNVRYRSSKIARLEQQNILHQTVIPERAKWILYKKSGDSKVQKKNRCIIADTFKKYCGAVCIDEAQDIDKNMFEIIKSLHNLDIPLILMGDPKQDIKGSHCLRKLIELYPQSVTYISICHRCPKQHIDLANSVIPKEEWQTCDRHDGVAEICFHAENTLGKILTNDTFELKYISKKQGVYSTHQPDSPDAYLNSIFEEVTIVVKKYTSHISELQQLKTAFQLAKSLLENVENGVNASVAMTKIFKNFPIDKQDYGRIINSLPPKDHDEERGKIIVDSIDKVKGCEGNRCLFILTTDLAAYLFGEKKDDTATKCRLYVALTRSLNYLLIYITPEVEQKYGQEYIKNFFAQFHIQEVTF